MNKKLFDKTFNRIISNLEILNKLQRDIKPDITEYHAYLKELSILIKLQRKSVKNTKRSILLWARAHSAMSNGKWNPSEWFGISDASRLIMGAARGASPI